MVQLHTMKLPVRFVLLGAAFVAGCAVIAPSPPASDNAAVIALVDGARADAEAGQLARAEAALERALRIEPKNARLWQELARVKLRQGDYAQAESLAVRSNSWAGSDSRLRAENWLLIAEAREKRGDEKGAREALERAGH
jgi:tetratricopeptide (TPR) repeat protein